MVESPNQSVHWDPNLGNQSSSSEADPDNSKDINRYIKAYIINPI